MKNKITEFSNENWSNIEKKILQNKKIPTDIKKQELTALVKSHPELHNRAMERYPFLIEDATITTTTENNGGGGFYGNDGGSGGTLTKMTINRKENVDRKETVDLNKPVYSDNPINTIVNTGHNMLSPFWNILNAVAEVIRTAVTPGRVLVLGLVYASLFFLALIWIAQYQTGYQNAIYENHIIEQKIQGLYLQHQYDSIKQKFSTAKITVEQKKSIPLQQQKTDNHGSSNNNNH